MTQADEAATWEEKPKKPTLKEQTKALTLFANQDEPNKEEAEDEKGDENEAEEKQDPAALRFLRKQRAARKLPQSLQWPPGENQAVQQPRKKSGKSFFLDLGPRQQLRSGGSLLQVRKDGRRLKLVFEPSKSRKLLIVPPTLKSAGANTRLGCTESVAATRVGGHPRFVLSASVSRNVNLLACWPQDSEKCFWPTL